MLYLQSMKMLVRCALTEPMWQRLKRQEGALLGIVASVLFFMNASPQEALFKTGLTFLTLSTLYFFNDLKDCIEDQSNPRKDQPYVSALVQHRKFLWISLGAQKTIVLGLALHSSVELAFIVLSIFFINTAYSLRVKGIPYLDVVWAGLWGAGITAIAGLEQPGFSFLIVGFMTAISHIYQVRLDADVDSAHNVLTSAVLSPKITEVQIIALSIGLGAILTIGHLPMLGLTAITPWILGKYLNSNRAWVFARYYFGIIWLCYLESVYGRLAQF